MIFSLSPPWTLILVGVLVALAIRVRPRSQRLRKPPGPPGLPFIGNMLDMPQEYDWLHWQKHRDLYGPISKVSVLGTTIIILNDWQLAVDVLNKRSAIYSDRPITTFCAKL